MHSDKVNNSSHAESCCLHQEAMSDAVSKAEILQRVSHKRDVFRALNLVLMLVTCHNHGHPTLDPNTEHKDESSESEAIPKRILKGLEGVAQILVPNNQVMAVTVVLTEGGSGLSQPPFTTPLLQLICVVTHRTEDDGSKEPLDLAKDEPAGGHVHLPTCHEDPERDRKGDKDRVDGASKGIGDRDGDGDGDGDGGRDGGRVGGADEDKDGQDSEQNTIVKFWQRVAKIVFYCSKNSEQKPTTQSPPPPPPPPNERIQPPTNQERPGSGKTGGRSDRSPDLETQSQPPVDEPQSDNHLATTLPDVEPKGKPVIEDWLPEDFLL